MRLLQEGLLIASGLNWRGGGLEVDSVFHHAWRSSGRTSFIVEAKKCNCGLVMSDDVSECQGSWSLVHSEQHAMFPRNLQYPPKVPSLESTKLTMGAILDVRSSKINAIMLALDTCVALTNIGAMILKTDES